MPPYRYLKAAAHDVLHSMASGLGAMADGHLIDHLGWAALVANVTKIELDLLAGQVEPHTAATAGLRAYAASGQRLWPQMLAGVRGDPGRVRAVRITAMFDLAQRIMVEARPYPEIAFITRLVATVTDDRGVDHIGAPARNQLFLSP